MRGQSRVQHGRSSPCADSLFRNVNRGCGKKGSATPPSRTPQPSWGSTDLLPSTDTTCRYCSALLGRPAAGSSTPHSPNAGWCGAEPTKASPSVVEERALHEKQPFVLGRGRRQVKERAGALHVLMNIVGSNALVRFPEIDVEEWNKIFEINVVETLRGIQTCAPLIKDSGGGSIVNIGSVAGITGNFSAGYSSSK
jgi:short chain dehydrogenase